ncbi:MAG: 16S rRNA (guanine(527)-N(7))-methyltransferase RsmG [Firmicutes bacterium]|nr:16S rRNA (guanine(527)-N(7))-methyltransferase RsmG [Bacillota bacterium]
MGLLAETLFTGAVEMGIEITEGQIKKFEKYYLMLIETNKRFNITSIVEEKEVAVKHFLDSLTCLKAASFEENMSLADIGTGAGFPGIPLKICQPALCVTLVESMEKRVTFLREVIQMLGLKKIEAVHARAEDLGRKKEYRERYDRVVARAVADLRVLAEYCLPAVKKGGIFLAMKGPKVESEITAAEKAIEILGGKIENLINLRLPFIGDERNLVVIKKVRQTPEKYPRRAGMPQKKPI